MDNIQRRTIRSSQRGVPKRALIVPTRRNHSTELVDGKPYLATKTVSPALPHPADDVQLRFSPVTDGLAFSVSLMPVNNTLRLPQSHMAIKRFSLWLVAVAVLFFSLYVSLDALQTTNQAKEQFSNPPPADQPTPQAPAVSEAKPPVDWLVTYKVAPDLPRIISIPSLGVKARVTKQGLTADGSLQAPKNIYDTGWYESSSKPGQGGAVLIDGHATGPTAAGVFDNIEKLSPGDVISLERGDGRVFSYAVNKTEITPTDKVNMAKLLVPFVEGTSSLNLISCTGTYDAKTNTYADRVVVFATQL